MIRRLRMKFVCINMVLMTAMLVLIFTLQYRSTAASLEQSSIDALQNASTEMFLPLRPGEQSPRTGVLTFAILENGRGELLVTGNEYYDLTDETLIGAIYSAAAAQSEEIGVLQAYSLRYLRSESPMGTRYTFTDISSERETLSLLVKTYLLMGLVVFVALLGISILLARWAVKPVARAWEQQRQFVADASHELKTPLTVILTNAELLEEPNCDGETRQRLTGSILSMSRQMRGLVENLLQLARADSGRNPAVTEKVDISQLIDESILPFEPLYFEQGLMLECVCEPEITVTGSPGQLRQVADILLDNALKYSAPASTVTLTLQRSHNRCLLTLFSPGVALSQQQCRDIFKRFYRAEESRTTAGSYGLGLAIAQSIVTGHQGRIWAEPVQDGNLFCVSLPVSQGKL